LLKEETPKFISSYPCHPNSPDLNPVDYVGNTAKEGVPNTHHLSGLNETACENKMDQAGSLQQPFVSGIVSGSRSVMRVLHTFSCSIPHML